MHSRPSASPLRAAGCRDLRLVKMTIANGCVAIESVPDFGKTSPWNVVGMQYAAEA
jgi:hypothetical protein